MQNFNVDISSPGGPLVFYAMQADSLSRFFTLTITDNGEAWDPPSGALWSVRFGAPQMPSGWYDTITKVGGGTHPAIDVSGNVATVEIAEQALESPGKNVLCILVTNSSGYQIANWPITLQIQPVPGLTAPEATTYYNLLTAQVAQAFQSAQNAATSATAAANSAELSESWAVGGTGSRAGEDTNNSKYWAKQSQAAANNLVASFNGRTGAVMPKKGDYTAADVGALAADGTAVAAKTAAVCSGNAATATKLATARKIGGASFNGTANITLAQIGALAADGTAVAAKTAAVCSGNAATATKLATARKIGGASFNGTANITLDQMGALAKASGLVLLDSGSKPQVSIPAGAIGTKPTNVTIPFSTTGTPAFGYAEIKGVLVGWATTSCRIDGSNLVVTVASWFNSSSTCTISWKVFGFLS